MAKIIKILERIFRKSDNNYITYLWKCLMHNEKEIIRE